MYAVTKMDVSVTREADLTWLVYLGQQVVARFLIAGDALAYASILECDHRVRTEALSN